MDQREQANDEAVYRKVLDARGVFMTGGDQVKLLSVLSRTKLCAAMRQAYIDRGACIAGLGFVLVARGRGIDVIGQGAVTLVDGREMHTRLIGKEDQKVFQATDVRLHLLPSGSGFIPLKPSGARGEAEVSDKVREVVGLLAGPDAVDTQFRGQG